jgi:putative ABC transport system substrate-binding protein
MIIRIIGAVLLSLAMSLAVLAQTPGRLYRIGVLDDDAFRIDAFREELAKLGWLDGKNIKYEIRLAGARELQALAAELVQLNVDLIFAPNTTGVQAAKRATSAIPIVFAVAADPVGSGLINSLGAPGGNITGLSPMNVELGKKRLELLKTVLPKLKRVGVLGNQQLPYSAGALREMEQAAHALNLRIEIVDWRNKDDLEQAFSALRRSGSEAFVVLPNPANWPYRAVMADLAIKYRLPGIFPAPEYAEIGGLIAYGPSFLHLYLRAAVYVDKILKGAKPASLPVEQPTKLDFVINVKTARALGLTIPDSILVRADSVIK